MRLLPLGSVSLLIASGCSATVVDGAEEGATSESRGSVAVEQVVSHTSDGPSMRTRVSARFLRASGGIDATTAEQVVGSPSRVSRVVVGSDPARGCRWDEGRPSSSAPATEGSIELLDVGDIVLRAGSQIMPLAARAFPDVGELVSGVIYTSRGGDNALPLAGTYLIETTGSAWVDGFSMRVEAPDAPTGVRLSQGGDSLPLDAVELVLDAQSDLTLTWDIPEGRSPGDRIVLELVAEAESSAIVCGFDDVGAAVVPAGLLAPGEVELSVHRFRRVAGSPVAAGRALDSGAVDEAVVDFDFAVTARAAVE